MPHFDKLTGTYLPDFSFGIHHTYMHNAHYITYIYADRDTLILINPFDSLDTKKFAVNNLLKKHIPYNVGIERDTLYCLGDKEYIFKQLKIDTTLNEVMSVDLKSELNNNPNEFIYSSLVVDKSLAFIYPYLIIPFGKYDAKNNCGRHAWKIVNLLLKKAFTTLDFPEKYRKCDLRNPYSIIESGDSNYVYTTFLKFDRIYKVNIENGEVVSSTKDSIFPNRFICYDAESKHNMAYKDKYERTDENNENLIFNPQKKQLFLIKRLRKENKKDATRCALLVFDSNLKYIGTYYTSGGLYPRLSYWYKDGIVITDSSFSKGHYYAFHN
jgi:hypothetical protein